MHGPLNAFENSLIRALPKINRARESYLYMKDSSRWLDLWADNTRALMGHRAPGVSLRIKNEIDKGLYAPYPGVWENRLVKALNTLFPGYSRVFLFSNTEKALSALGLERLPSDPLFTDYFSADLKESAENQNFHNFADKNSAAHNPADKNSAAQNSGLQKSVTQIPAGVGASPLKVLWGRVALPDHPEADILFPIVPLPGLSEVQPVMLTDYALRVIVTGKKNQQGISAENQSAADVPEGILSGDSVSQVILAAYTRALYSVKARNIPIKEEIADIWECRGPYMIIKPRKLQSSEIYNKLFMSFFNNNILIAPSAERPSVFPLKISEGDMRRIIRISRSAAEELF